MQAGSPTRCRPQCSRSVEQIRDVAGHDVPLTTFGTPPDADYWAALDDLGYRQANVLLPTKPLDESLTLLDAIAEKVAAYRG